LDLCLPTFGPTKAQVLFENAQLQKSWVFDGTYQRFIKNKSRKSGFPIVNMNFNLTNKLPDFFSAKKITSPSRNWVLGHMFYSFLVLVMISRRVTDQQPPYVFNLKPPTYPTGLAASTVLRPYAVGRFHGSSLTPVTLALLRAVGCGASPQQLLLHCAAAGCPVLGDRQGGKLGRYRQRYRHPEN